MSKSDYGCIRPSADGKQTETTSAARVRRTGDPRRRGVLRGGAGHRGHREPAWAWPVRAKPNWNGHALGRSPGPHGVETTRLTRQRGLQGGSASGHSGHTFRVASVQHATQIHRVEVGQREPPVQRRTEEETVTGRRLLDHREVVLGEPVRVTVAKPSVTSPPIRSRCRPRASRPKVSAARAAEGLDTCARAAYLGAGCRVDP